MSLYIGIDLGGTNIKVGLVDEQKNIIATESTPTDKRHDSNKIICDIAQLARRVVVNSGHTLDDVKWAGIGSPGSIDSKNGTIVFWSNLNFHNVEIKKRLEELLNIDVYVENDANAAAFGEFITLDDNNINNFILMTLGTGVGGGIIINKRLYSGCNGAAGEVGHMQIMADDGEKCACGRGGCLEKYASVTALKSQTKRAMQENKDTLMWEFVGSDVERVSGRLAFDCAKKGDAVAQRVVSEYLRYVAEGITNIVNIFQPDVLAIGGAISKEGDYLLNPILDWVQKNRYSRGDIQTRVEMAALGNNAGIIGAAMLGKQEK